MLLAGSTLTHTLPREEELSLLARLEPCSSRGAVPTILTKLKLSDDFYRLHRVNAGYGVFTDRKSVV